MTKRFVESEILQKELSELKNDGYSIIEIFDEAPIYHRKNDNKKYYAIHYIWKYVKK